MQKIITPSVLLRGACATAIMVGLLSTGGIVAHASDMGKGVVTGSILQAGTLSAPVPLTSVVSTPGKPIQVPLASAVPEWTTAVTLRVETAGAWRDTDLYASFNTGEKVFVTTSHANSKEVSTVTLNVPKDYDGKLTFTSTMASVRVTASVISSVQAAPVSTTPDATNTGVPAGTKLTVQTGSLTVTTPGAIIDGIDLHGKLNIKANNVTVKNSIIRGADNDFATPGFLVNNNSGFTGLKITDSEITSTVVNANTNGIVGSNFTLTHVNIHHVIDTVHLTGGNVTVEKSWLHDNLHYEQDPNWNGSPSHDDSIQIQAGSNINIIGNNISGSHTSGVMVTQDRGPVSNLKVTNNLIDGGACSINLAEKTYGPLQGVSITDNKFGRNTKLENCAIIAKLTTQPYLNLANNFYTDGVEVKVRRG